MPFDETLAPGGRSSHAACRTASPPSATRSTAWSRSGSPAPTGCRAWRSTRATSRRPGDRRVRPQPRPDRHGRRAPDRAARRLPRGGPARAAGRPARAARRATSREGRYVEPLPVTSKDELGQLTDTFNRMQEQLRQVDVARKEFIATASHELRTPIFSLVRVRGAAPGRGPRRGHAPRVPRDDGRAGGAAPEALRGPARPLAARLRLGPAPPRVGGPRGAQPLHRGRVPPPARRTTGPRCGSRCPRRARTPTATANGSLRSCVSSSTTPSATRRRARTSR